MEVIRNVAGELFLQVSPGRARDFFLLAVEQGGMFSRTCGFYCQVSPSRARYFLRRLSPGLCTSGHPADVLIRRKRLILLVYHDRRRFSRLWGISRRVSPLSGELLFFAPPKKSSQKKGVPKACPLTRVPCASRRFGRSPNSQDLPRLRLANPAQTGQLAFPQTGCDARLRLTGSNPRWFTCRSAL
jgi:hypothetical protein